MRTLLLPITTIAEASRAATAAIAKLAVTPARVLLLNVQRPLPRHVTKYFPQCDVHAYLHEAGMTVLAPAIAALEAAGIAHEDHVVVGYPAAAIVEFARTSACEEVVLDEPAHGIASLLRAGSVPSQVRRLMHAHA